MKSLLFSRIEKKKKVPSFEWKSLDGQKEIRIQDYKGQVILLVNTASKCLFTRQYHGLQQLHETYSSEGLVIIGIPCNDFGHQEPGTSQEIQKFCLQKYKTSFLLTKKYSVVGPKAHPFFLWIQNQRNSSFLPKWNFYKYLIDRNGHFCYCFSSLTHPQSFRFKRVIKKLL